MDTGRLILSIIGIIVVLILAYYVTYFIGTRASGQKMGTMRNRNISLLDRFAISRTASFCVVEIAEKVYIIGVTGNSMTLLDTIEASVYAQSIKETQTMAPMPWANTPVGKYGNKLTKSLIAFIASKSGTLNTDEGSPSAGFADNLKQAQEKTADTNQTSETSKTSEDD